MNGIEITKEIREKILEAARDAFGPAPLCYFCKKNRSTEIIMRLIKPSDLTNDEAFTKMMLERNNLPQSCDGQPALYVCKDGECKKKAQELLNRLKEKKQ